MVSKFNPNLNTCIRYKFEFVIKMGGLKDIIASMIYMLFYNNLSKYKHWNSFFYEEILKTYHKGGKIRLFWQI